MKTKNFSFELPEELIAQNPADERGSSRLMRVQRAKQSIEHLKVPDLIELIPAESVLVLNDSRVRKARLYGQTEYGGTVEFLLIRPLQHDRWQCIVSKAKRQKIGRTYSFPGSVSGRIVDQKENMRTVQFDVPVDDDYLERYGHMPLPPYIRREDTCDDHDRYQTVYAEKPGSVAAPTAGLHLTKQILEQLELKGVQVARVTLHVGIGTFLPIRTDDVESHSMHTEQYFVPSGSADIINRAKQEGRTVCAVGTTSVRTLESAWNGEAVAAGEGSTNLYIYPGYHFNVVDMMLTNFHTPESTLLVMVSAFAGKELIEKAYREAIRERYRFFSYGDAMLIQ